MGERHHEEQPDAYECRDSAVQPHGAGNGLSQSSGEVPEHGGGPVRHGFDRGASHGASRRPDPVAPHGASPRHLQGRRRWLGRDQHCAASSAARHRVLRVLERLDLLSEERRPTRHWAWTKGDHRLPLANVGGHYGRGQIRRDCSSVLLRRSFEAAGAFTGSAGRCRRPADDAAERRILPRGWRIIGGRGLPAAASRRSSFRLRARSGSGGEEGLARREDAAASRAAPACKASSGGRGARFLDPSDEGLRPRDARRVARAVPEWPKAGAVQRRAGAGAQGRWAAAARMALRHLARLLAPTEPAHAALLRAPLRGSRRDARGGDRGKSRGALSATVRCIHRGRSGHSSREKQDRSRGERSLRGGCGGSAARSRLTRRHHVGKRRERLARFFSLASCGSEEPCFCVCACGYVCAGAGAGAGAPDHFALLGTRMILR
mmetsp:Transcript_1097/g.4679  ORF Transcript_1097/g.4679 Transcript_1097/m.4679 type:complete len:434 (+) Transcript_1097:3473-4774(+)